MATYNYQPGDLAQSKSVTYQRVGDQVVRFASRPVFQFRVSDLSGESITSMFDPVILTHIKNWLSTPGGQWIIEQSLAQPGPPTLPALTDKSQVPRGLESMDIVRSCIDYRTLDTQFTVTMMLSDADWCYYQLKYL